ncbi:hypothetical protein XacyCFBP2565_06895 [Xanthomonas arboricola pv. corylina]|uniref:hypothetical protein n=1 Tax=Xanthomonas arboricola TaxID=56448 RepID=UPI000CEF3348|nr:hypothetical protein [Xanthomonas arboricola]PPU15545.1 hypothetical protein XacyCFBP2565_06895 [Xanthomonas arboricola pv. corylina]
MNEIEKRARELAATEVDVDAGLMPEVEGAKEVAASIRDGGDGNLLFVPTALRAVLAALSQQQDGYIDAFYEVAEMLDIGARVRIPGTDEGSPKHVWETEMRPMLMDALRRKYEERVYHAALQRIGSALGLPAGSDLTTQCIPAIEELRRATGRYWWLRDVHIGDEPHYINLASGPKHGLDSAIDAAMLAAKPEHSA